MNEDLLRALAHNLGSDTADCPTLMHRVAAGVARRRRRHRVLAGALAAVVVGVAGPAVVLDGQGGGRTGGAICSGAPSTCGSQSSVQAELALRRANSPDFAGFRVVNAAGVADSCLHRPYCRGPV